MSQWTPNDIEAFIRRTDIETQQLRTRSPASTVFIPHITLLPGKNYTTPKKYEEAMSKALEKNQQHLQEEVTAEVVPSYQDLDQRLTTVEKRLGLRKEEKKKEEEKSPIRLQDCCMGLGVMLFAYGFTIGLIYLAIIS